MLRQKNHVSRGTLGAIFIASLLFALPLQASAFSFTGFIKSFFGWSIDAAAETTEATAKPFPFLSAVQNSDPKIAVGGGGLEIVDDAALVPVVGPMGSIADVAELSQSYRITTYTVREGDTISLIAETFDITPATIRWANDISRTGSIKPGQVLVILPVSGVKHTVARGDTVASIAKKYGGDPDDIYDFNGLTVGEALAAGSVVLVPDGELTAPPVDTRPSGSTPTYVRAGGPEIAGYYIRPVSGGRRSRGVHGYNGVDLANSCGTPVYASAGGTVAIARSSGWNGGYGKYVAIAHPNGTQTLYAHLSSVDVSVAAGVTQGQLIGLVGTTGKSTGCHLHFEIRGAKNPF
ncbi:MAG: M23 family metallopeptidase [Patescibacteria group bacterium]